jgi:hypothetical protein
MHTNRDKMDTEEYKQAVLEMYKAMQDVFAANETLRVAAERVWTWDKAPHDQTNISSIRELPSPILPPSPRSEPEEEDAEPVPCGCASDIWKPCVHVCSICDKALTLRDSEGLCWMCEEDLVTVEKDWPYDAADAKMNSVYGKGAFHALVLRIRANNCREAADDTDDAEEVRNCLKEAERLDARATELLNHKSPYHYKPWWFARWDYWMQPGSTHEVPAWAEPKALTVASPCGGHTTPAGTRYKHTFSTTCSPAPVAAPAPCTGCLSPTGFHLGICTSAPPPLVEEVAVDLEAVAAKAKPDYKHPLWPSPRPKLFAKALGSKIKKHEEALEFLAQRAKITVEGLLKMDPETYAEKHMGGKRNAPYNCYKQRGWPYTFYGY